MHLPKLEFFFTCILSLNLGSIAASIGDPAPPLSVEYWVKGTPTRILPGTNTYVVEFWATWCGPCKRSIPHLTEVQKKYAPSGVIVLGLSDEDAATVTPFVVKQGETMGYRVGTDPSKKTFRAWMDGFGENGIPHAFVVDKSGKVVWHGFPNEALDRALKQILAGEYDLEYAKNVEAGQRLVEYYGNLVAKPNAVESAKPTAEKILNQYSKDWRIPKDLAETILTGPKVRSRDLQTALAAANKAVEMTGGRAWTALEMQARALFATGKKKEAVEAQKKAIAACNSSEDQPELQKFLAIFEKGAQKP